MSLTTLCNVEKVFKNEAPLEKIHTERTFK